ncbi:PREDICTED: microfibril-associated glycoprotein 4-like [Branchiostoma belcheri]|uniref:Microfibril-associated glycoprotein 4-like n=1 Tax=Branchiostoma belcheri TaxID=7741 RepID=A0A6P4YF46_BRABE|nr:PREDICTED: microfibril-associated glycoprotein 4-like [Branchiostoma belcheri]
MESKTPGTVLDQAVSRSVPAQAQDEMGTVWDTTVSHTEDRDIRVADVSFTAFTGKAEDNILHRTSLARDCMIQLNFRRIVVMAFSAVRETVADDTPSTKNTQRNAPTSHENGNNVGQQKTTYESLSRKPEKPDNVDGQPSHTDPTTSAVSTRPENYFSDCSEIHTAKTGYGGVSDGVNKILPVGLSSPISVYCDQTTDGGGWTVIQRRFDGSVDFNRPYDAFKYGFGSPNGEHWLGLENIYRLTDQHTYTLYVQLEDWDNVVKYARYSSFSVGSSSSNYHLSVSGYSGTAGDGFGSSSSISDYHLSGQPFSARDVDCDTNPESCAVSNAYTGGWWYKSCGLSALNGPYLCPSDFTGHSGYGIYWAPFGGSYTNYLKKSKMMVRPANFKT